MNTSTSTVSTQQSLLTGSALCLQMDDTTILDKVSICVNPGEMIGLIGPNGAGKSSLLSMLAGLTVPTSGSVLFNSTRLSTMPAQQRARDIGWLEQIGQIHWPLSVYRLVSLGRFPHQATWQTPNAEDEQAVAQALSNTHCSHLADRDVTTLSGGERARVLLARVLAAKPKLILADEPVSALDLGHQLQSMSVLRTFARGEQACVVVLHDLSLAARFCDRLYLLDQGLLVSEGTAAHVLTNDNIRNVYGVEVISGCDDIPWIVPHSLTAL